MQDTANGAGVPQDDPAGPFGESDRNAGRSRSVRTGRFARSPASPAEGQPNERPARVLVQKRGPDPVIMGTILCAALLFSLIGLAAHFLWIIAIIIMALGLGYIIANSRRNAST
jgi:hypothetical protein